jgi:CRISPR-associated exonuclease Cas4
MRDTNAKPIPISALQHYAYCPRQCALIHLEQSWAENRFTAHGRIVHQRVDGKKSETRKGIRVERSVEVYSEKYNLSGKLDALEIDLESGNLCPVEYKRGKPKLQDWDRIQLCAQALCLEEMRNTAIEYAALWYWETRRRDVITLDCALRELTTETVAAVSKQFADATTPAAIKTTRCRACSLIDLCSPDLSGSDHSSDYIARLYKP